jgi:hypothetical protein
MKKRKTKVDEFTRPLSSVSVPPAKAAGKKKLVNKSEIEENRPPVEESSDPLDSGTVINYSRPAVSKPLKVVNFTPSALRFSTLNPLNPSIAMDNEEFPVQSFNSRFSDFQGATSTESDGGLIRKLLFTTKDCQTPGRYDARQKQSGQPMQVFLRIRPLLEFDQINTEENTSERAEGDPPLQSFIRVDDEYSVTLNAPPHSVAFRSGEKESKFTFTKVFTHESGQEEVFNTAVLPVVDSFYSKGTNGLIFAYGITNSGKSFTMQGSAAQPGIIPRVICSVFEKIFTNQKSSDRERTSDGEEIHRDSLLFSDPETSGSLMPHFSMQISFLEIYNERIFDLLAAANPGQSRAECKLQHTKSDEVYVSGLREVSIANHKEALLILQQGLMNRKVGETLLNSDSSRSHSVFTIKLVTQDGQIWSRLSIVDLAGSERCKRTQHNEAGGSSKLREAVNINTSLLVLGRCLESLRWNQLHPKLKPKQIPFRESKITRLFRDSLTGWGRTVMICNTSQTPADYDETIHALKYAAIAREIRVMPRVDTTNQQYLQANRDRLKRLAEKSLPELDQEHNSSLDDVDMELQKAAQRARSQANKGRSSIVIASNSADQEEIDNLLDQIFHLKQLLVATEAKCAEIETNVRMECVNEMENQAQQTQEFYKQNLNYEKQQITQVWERKIKVIKEEMEDKLQAAMKQNHQIQGSQVNNSVLPASGDLSLTLDHQLECEKYRQQIADLQRQLQQKIDENRQQSVVHQQQVEHLQSQHRQEMEEMKGWMKQQQEQWNESHRIESDQWKRSTENHEKQFQLLHDQYEMLKAHSEDQSFIIHKVEQLCEEYNGLRGNNVSVMEFLIQIRDLVLGENDHEEENQSKKVTGNKRSNSFSQENSESSQIQSQSHSNSQSNSIGAELSHVEVEFDGNPAPEGQRQVPKQNQAISKTQPLNPSSISLVNTVNSNINKTAPPFSTPAKPAQNSFLAAALAILTKKKSKQQEEKMNSSDSEKSKESSVEEENKEKEKEKEKEAEKLRKQREKEEKAAKKQAEKEEKERLKEEAKARAAEEKERKKREKELEKEKKNQKEKENEFHGAIPLAANKALAINGKSGNSLDAEWLDLLSPIAASNTDSPSFMLTKGQLVEKKYGAQKGRHRHETSNVPAFQSQSSIPFRGVVKYETNESSFTFYGDESIQLQEESDKENIEDDENGGRKGRNKRSKQNEIALIAEPAPVAKRTRGKK